MDTALDDDQLALRALAREVFAGSAPVERVVEVEAAELARRNDGELWAALAQAGLLGVSLPEAAGGAGLGVVEAALVCAEHGRVVAPVPLAWTLAAALAVAEFGDAALRESLLPRVVAGEAVLTCVPPAAGGVTGRGTRLSGVAVGVPYAGLAEVVFVPVGADVYLVEPGATGVRVEVGTATSREPHAVLTLDDVPAVRLGEGNGGAGVAAWLERRLLVLLAATQSGVTDAAVRMTAEYTSARHQFDKPLSTFQGVALRAADAYVDAAGIAAAVTQAAWRLDRGEDAEAEVLTAAWWAAEAGQRCVHATQHLHGGMGADVTYPVHRYFLWGKQLELLVGGASALLARLGDALVRLDDPGDALLTSPGLGRQAAT